MTFEFMSLCSALQRSSLEIEEGGSGNNAALAPPTP